MIVVEVLPPYGWYCSECSHLPYETFMNLRDPSMSNEEFLVVYNDKFINGEVGTIIEIK